MRFTISIRLLVPFLSCLFLVTAPRADINDITWGSPEIVDTGSPIPANTSGISAEHVPENSYWSGLDQWHVVYEKDGDIFHVIRDDNGWQTPEPMGTLGPAREPKLTFSGAYLHLVWEEDDRSGKPEIWTRIWDGTDWLDPVCLTQDQIPSRAPVIASGPGDLFLAWQEGVNGARSVVGKYRIWNDTEWGPTEAISMSSREAMEPSVAITPNREVHVAWTDTRSVIQTEVFLRSRDESGAWQDEIRMTDLPGDSDRPCVYAPNDLVPPWDAEMMLVFENDQTGTPEVYGLCYRPPGVPPEPILISPDDGVPSIRPNVHGFTFMLLSDFNEFYYGKYLLAYSDSVVPGDGEHVVVLFDSCGDEYSQETLAISGTQWMLVSATEGSPNAEILALWTEQLDRTDQLLSLRGQILGCSYPQILFPLAILLSPEGVPENAVSATNGCVGGAPLEGFSVEMIFSNDLDEQLTWDPGQTHPHLPPVETDQNGEAAFPIYGGGCSDVGDVTIRVNGVTIAILPGAKSPDVDGDCLVELEDLIYVEARIGTDDFCADLNGDETVDLEDLLIVEEALGDFCPSLVDVEEGFPGEAPMPLISIQPNPCRDQTVIYLEAVDGPEIGVRLYDAAGRLVSDLGTRPHRPGSSGFVWDGRDQAGHRVGSGIYFAVARVDDRVTHRPLILVR